MLVQHLKKYITAVKSLLEQVLATLFLWSEAGHSPDLDLYAGVELLAPHVPHALIGRRHCFILRREPLHS